MLILGIESSCDETACAVVDANDATVDVKSDIVATQIATHALYGGVVPEIASRAHTEAITNVASRALTDAGVTMADIDAVAVTNRPGLIGALLVGVSFAKACALTHSKPLIAVNHIKAHTAAVYAENPGLVPSYISLVVSGGHTSLYSVTDFVTFNEIGGTRDDAAGEAFDKAARVMGLKYPGGREMDRLAGIGFEKYTKRELIKLPSPALAGDTLDFSFSGIKTAAVNHIHNVRQKLGLAPEDPFPEDEAALVAASFTYAVIHGIADKLGSALRQTGTKTAVMAGGVAANSHLRRAVAKECGKCGAALYVPKPSLCGDNGVMVALQGYREYCAGNIADTSLNAYAD